MKKILSFLFCLFLVTFSFAENIGLVFSGGGAKGAYEIGVWKALKEYGLEKNVKVISGTSVGALNGALFVCVSEKEAEKLWQNEVGYSSFLMPDSSSITFLASTIYKQYVEGSSEKYEAVCDEYEEEGKELSKLKSVLYKLEGGSIQGLKEVGKWLYDYLLKDNHSVGLFQRDDLERIIGENVSLKKLNKANIDVYVTTIRKRRLLAKGLASKFIDLDFDHSFLLNEQTDDSYVKELLLASSALPLAYPSQKIHAGVIENGKRIDSDYEYIDGGFELIGGKNTPVGPVLNSDKADTIIVVYLKSAEEIDYALASEEYKKELDYSGKKMIEIIPSQNLGNMISGTVNFSAGKIIELMQLGYDDTVKILKDNGYYKSFTERIFDNR